MDLSAERTQLLERDAEWAAAASEGRDIERVLSYWTEDAVVLPPGLPPVIGKAALRQYVLASLQIPGFQISWTSRRRPSSHRIETLPTCLAGTPSR